MDSILRNKLLLVTYAMTFLYALHYAIPLYATSSYLHKYFSASIVSAIYVLGSMFALIISLSVSKSIKKFHTYQFAFFITILEIVIVLLFGNTENRYLLPIYFIIHFVLQILLYISLNVFIESFSKHTNTGSIRGLFLAILSLGILISPLFGGMLLAHFSFSIFIPLLPLSSSPIFFFYINTSAILRNQHITLLMFLRLQEKYFEIKI